MDHVHSSHTAIPSLTSYRTSKPPCCLALLSVDPPILAVGMYELADSVSSPDSSTALDAPPISEQAQQRTGAVAILRLSSASNAPSGSELAHRTTSYGILDLIRINLSVLIANEQPQRPSLAAASSIGTIELFHFQPNRANLTHSCSLQVGAPDEVITQLRWHPRRRSELGFTTAHGRVALLQLLESQDLPHGQTLDVRGQVQTLYQHGLEAWCLAFPASEATGEGVWSGGDDAVVAWNPIEGSSEKAVSSQPWVNRKIHGAGVTALLPVELPGGGSVLVTGSYDDRIRVLGLGDGAVQRPKLLAEKDLGGGVWRLKLLALHSSSAGESRCVVRVLACCMYAGARIVELSGTDAETNWDVKVLAQFTEHESMCYGCEAWMVKEGDTIEGQELSTSELSERGGVNPELAITRQLEGRPDDGEPAWIMATCSFYDRRLCIWRFDERDVG